MAGLAKDLPPKSTVHGYLDCGSGMAPWPATIDSQSVKSAEKGGVNRPFGLWRGQKAAHPRRYAQPDPGRPHPARRCPRSQQRVAGAQGDPPPLSVHCPGLRRWRRWYANSGRGTWKSSSAPNRRERATAKGFENLARMGLLAFLRLAIIRLMLRRIARHRRS